MKFNSAKSISIDRRPQKVLAGVLPPNPFQIAQVKRQLLPSRPPARKPASVRKYAERLGVKFRLGMADDRALELYGPIRSIPTTIFINRRGHLIRRVVGYIDAETMEAYARELF